MKTMSREGTDSGNATSSRTAAENESQLQQRQERRQAFIDSLRACATFLETHPDVEFPRYNTMNVFVDTREELAAHAKAATWAKVFNGQWFYLSHAFGPDLSLDITAGRELVCQRVVTGTRTEPERIVEDVEWVCDREFALLGDAQKAEVSDVA